VSAQLCVQAARCQAQAEQLQRNVGQLNQALRQLFQVCVAMDAEVQDDRPEESAYQAALAFAANVLGVPWPPAGWPGDVPDAMVTRTTGFVQVIDPPATAPSLQWDVAGGELNTEGRV
jgi:hypothetical protein